MGAFRPCLFLFIVQASPTHVSPLRSRRAPVANQTDFTDTVKARPNADFPPTPTHTAPFRLPLGRCARGNLQRPRSTLQLESDKSPYTEQPGAVRDCQRSGGRRAKPMKCHWDSRGRKSPMGNLQIRRHAKLRWVARGSVGRKSRPDAKRICKLMKSLRIFCAKKSVGGQRKTRRKGFAARRSRRSVENLRLSEP